jgi:segregation and condensation protein B
MIQLRRQSCLPARRDPTRLPTNARLPHVYRLLSRSENDKKPADPLAREPQLALLEAALLIADEPLPLRKLAQTIGTPESGTVRRLLKRLQECYDADATAFQIEELAGGFQLLTRPEYHRWLSSLRRANQEVRLTAPARETLAIRLLMEKGLVKIVGRDDSLGRPVLYGTTKKFLQSFGLRSLKDLPHAEQFAGQRAVDGDRERNEPRTA